MSTRPDPLSFKSLIFSWVGAGIGAFFALILTVCAQGIVSIGGGCRWIGFTLAVDHQPWALLNLPNLGFSGRPEAIAYWLAGIAACLLFGLLAVPLLPRPRKLGFELLVIQAAWMSLLVGVAWLPLLDSWDGHLSHFLRIRELNAAWVWVAPVLAAWAAMIPALRLLALLRKQHPAASGLKRGLTIAAHFGIPALCWLLFGLILQRPLLQAAASSTSMPGLELLLRSFWAPILGSLLPLLAVFLLALRFYPRPMSFKIEDVRATDFVGSLVVLALLGVLWAYAGRPAGNGMSHGMLWSRPDSRNNIRSWVLIPEGKNLPPGS